MSKLVSANFSRLFRNKFFWICFALVLGVAAFIAFDFAQSHQWRKQQISWETKEVCFKYMPVLAGIVALFVSLFIGEEYSNKTIRNKIASGYSKRQIYITNWIVCTAVAVLFCLVFFLTIALPIAPWKGLLEQNANVVVMFVRNGVVSLFAILALVSVSVFIAMFVKNRIIGVVAVLGCALVLFLAAEIMSKGINAGVMRTIIQTVMDVQPFGQILQVRYGYVTELSAMLLPVYSCLVMVLFGIGGAYLFRKRDLE